LLSRSVTNSIACMKPMPPHLADPGMFVLQFGEPGVEALAKLVCTFQQPILLESVEHRERAAQASALPP
jgi:hypothetical protein